VRSLELIILSDWRSTMNLRPFAMLLAVLSIGGCATTGGTSAYTPMERYLNRAAAAETAVSQCSGSYGDVVQMRNDAESNLAQARALGATDADIESARRRVAEKYAVGGLMVGQSAFCSSLVKELAWVGADPAL
jgi:hypothetical protein